jgi:hypothetical protein
MRPFDKHTSTLFDNSDSSSALLGGDTSPDLNSGFVTLSDSNDDMGGATVAVGSDSVRHGPTSTPTLTPFTPPVQPPSPTPFTIDINWDSSVANAPTAFTSDILAAVDFLETQFTNPVTITLDVGYGEIDNQTLSDGDLGESEANTIPVSYSSLLAAVTANANNPTARSVLASLPATSPVSDASYYVTTAQAKALGLADTNSDQVDGSVGFATASMFTYGDTNTSGTVAAGTYDFFVTAVHEITEDMGRQMGTTSRFGDDLSLMNLLDYSAPGTRDFIQTTPGYFSVDSGTTDLGGFNTDPSGDWGDWAASVPDDSFDAFATPGVPETVSPDDLIDVAAIGWQPAGSSGTAPPLTPPTSSGPTGVSFTPVTQFLAIGEGRGGLSAQAPLATVTEVGGTAGDQFNYTLSGTGASSFSLIPTHGGAVLAAGPSGVTGAVGGSLYALTVTATDETASGNPSASDPVNVVFGDNSEDAISLTSLSGIVASAPTFIYGLAGTDTINATGMTGTLYFDAGVGSDTMTGGSGQNVYEFGAGAGISSTPLGLVPHSPATPGLVLASAAPIGTVQDVITNFNVAMDLIDLTWVGCRFANVAPLSASATTIAPGSIGWQTSGGNTYVYANTSNRTEALTATNTKIELLGSVALTSANFGHT